MNVFHDYEDYKILLVYKIILDLGVRSLRQQKAQNTAWSRLPFILHVVNYC